MQLIKKLPVAETTADLIRREDEWYERRKAEAGRLEAMSREERTRLDNNVVLCRGALIIFSLFTVISFSLSEFTLIPSAFCLLADAVCFVIYHFRYAKEIRGQKPELTVTNAAGYLILLLVPAMVFCGLIYDTFNDTEGLAALIMKNLFSILLSILAVYIFIRMILSSFVILMSIFVRRIRCSFSCKADHRGYSIAGTELPHDAALFPEGYPQYVYKYEKTEMIISYMDDRTGELKYGKELDLLIDPDYPQYFYDRTNSLKQVFRRILRIFEGILLLLLLTPSVINIIEAFTAYFVLKGE